MISCTNSKNKKHHIRRSGHRATETGSTWVVSEPMGHPPRQSDCSAPEAMAWLSIMNVDTAASVTPVVVRHRQCTRRGDIRFA